MGADFDFHRVFRRLLTLAAVVTIVPAVLILLFQRSMIYLPRGYAEGRLSELEEAGGTLLRYRSDGQGEQVTFLVDRRLDPTGLPSKLWLVASGNGSVALDWLETVISYPDPETVFVLFDYPGYGLCEGRPSPGTIRRSVQSCRRALAEHFNVPESALAEVTAVLGHSIGAAAGLIAAEELGAQRAVLISPFTSMTDMARRIVGVPLCFLNLHRFDNRRQLRSFVEGGGVAEIFHGTEDTLIPLAMSEELAGLYPSSVRLNEIEGAGHNDVIGLASSQILEAMVGSKREG